MPQERMRFVIIFLSSYAMSLELECAYEFIEYLPSALEFSWLANVGQWGASSESFCQAVQVQLPVLASWLKITRQGNTFYPTTRNDLDPIFSKFKYLKRCKSENSSFVYSYIEPLATSLRSPLSLCVSSEDILDRSHYVFASRYDPIAYVASLTRRIFYFDMGASTWNSGIGGNSQNFLYSVYQKNGLIFARMLLWEVEKRDPVDLFSQVPHEVFHGYQYFNIPVSIEKDLRNPLEIMRKLTHRSDFVVLKLDIDNGIIENAILKQLMHDSELLALVDEVFFEHHVNFEPLIGAWGNTTDQSLTLSDSYQLMFFFRKAGVRFHGWP